MRAFELLQSIHVTRDQYFREWNSDEMNIRIAVCNFRHLHEILNISQEIFLKKDAEKKIRNTWETIVILEILYAVESRFPYSSVLRERRQYHTVLPSHFCAPWLVPKL